MQNVDVNTLADVVVRYCAHDNYGSKQNAVRALSKRTSIKDNKFLNDYFEMHLKIYDHTKRILTKNYYDKIYLTDKIFEKVKNQIMKTVDCTEIDASAYINWCHYWYNVK